MERIQGESEAVELEVLVSVFSGVGSSQTSAASSSCEGCEAVRAHRREGGTGGWARGPVGGGREEHAGPEEASGAAVTAELAWR